jgi:TRAP transporter 4TM/12TM fusion protein
MRKYKGVYGKIVWLIAIAFSLFNFAYGVYPFFYPHVKRAIFLLFGIVLVFLLYPASSKSSQKRPSVIDWLCIGGGIVACIYFILNFEQLAGRAGFYTKTDIALGIILILVVLEMARRKVSIAVTLVGIVGLLYCYFGPYLPAGIFRHAGIDISRIAGYLYATMDGIFGVPISVMSRYIFLIITFGAFLTKSGAADFIMDLSLSLVGHKRGGPAYTAIVASSLFAMISGSAQANVATTGVITIPFMKKVGYRPHNAAAIEVGASLGGGLCPPIMAASAFLIAGFTGIPFVTIAATAILPIILYYTAVTFFIVFISIKNKDLSVLPREELPNFIQVLKKRWNLLVPFVVIFFTIFSGYSPTRAGMLGIVSVVMSSYFKKKTRMDLKDVMEAFYMGAIKSLGVISAAACIGILVGAVGLSGIGIKFSNVLIRVAGGNLFILIILIGIASIIAGMGLPITAAYIVVSTLAVPALQIAGLPVLAAHFVVLWFCQSSAVTPPVCLTSYIAAGIAEANPFKTAMASFNIVKGLFIMPFLIAYTPLVSGTWGERFIVFGFSFIALVALTSCMERYMFKKLCLWETILLGMASIILLINVSLLLKIFGIGIVLGIFLHQYKGFSNSNHLQPDFTENTKSK